MRRRSSDGVSTSERVRDHISWLVLGPCLGAAAVGLALLASHIPNETKYFLSGALVGVGAGGAVAEITGAFERRDLHQRVRQLLEPVLADCRRAYRMGEFSFPFYNAVSRGERADHHVTEMLSLSESFDMRTSVEQAIRDADVKSPGLFDDFAGLFGRAMSFKGQHCLLFYKLGSDIGAIRGDDAKSNHEARTIVAERIGANLDRAAIFIDDRQVSEAWTRLVALWERDVLPAEEVDDLLLAFHVYLLVLGLEHDGFPAWKAIVDDLGRLRLGDAGRPSRLTPIVDAVRAART